MNAFARVGRWVLAAVAASLISVPAMAAETKSTAELKGYVLGPDDTISVSVYGQSDAGVQTRIKPDGTIVMPLIGNVQASGQTVVSLADLITKKLVAGGYFKDPVVNVEVGTFASKTVNIAGKVGQPGVYPLDRPYRALELLLKAGWVKDQGANYIYLRRDGKETKLETEALVRGAPDQDPLMQPEDTLYVPDADTFYIQGAINKPGALPVLPGMNVRQAIALAGGVTAIGNDKKVSVYRAGSKAKITLDTEALVQKGDVVVVKERLF